jgi:hypothetical protein
MAVPDGPGHRFGNLGQAAEGLAVPGEAWHCHINRFYSLLGHSSDLHSTKSTA